MDTGGARTWASLSLYESTELVRRFVEERTDEELDEAEAREIAAHFLQGREYFRSAAVAGELVRPLILYYGALSLARGAVLLLSPRSSIRGHGLKETGWENLYTRPDAVPALRVKVVPRGTFLELARVTGNVERATVRSVDLPHTLTVGSPGTMLEAETSLSLKEMLGQIPELAELYESTFREHSRRLRCEFEITNIPDPKIFAVRHSVLGYRSELTAS